MPSTMEFSLEELGELERVLDHELTRASVEVHRTDSLPFKRELQRQCDIDQQMLEKVRSAKASPVGV